VAGGEQGAPPKTTVDRADGSVEPLGRPARIGLDGGDTVTHTVCGAGGSGDPARRDPARTAADIRDGYRSA
jgi:N-methylhydantoinase B